MLDAWIADEPGTQPALRWLGILRRDASFLKQALALDPNDTMARRHLVDWLLGDVDYATHHLVESVLLGDLEATKQVLAEARAVAEAAPDRRPLNYSFVEIAEYEALLRDWEAYSVSPEGTFPEWCALRGRSYKWPTIVYYDND